MNSIRTIARLISLPFEWLQKQLSRDFKLRREGRHFRVVVEADSPPSQTPATVSGGQFMSADIAHGMQIELRQLIDRHMKTRELMRHLAYIERALRLGGPDALNDIPLEVLLTGHTQLKSLVEEWSSPGLSELKSRLAMSIAAKEAEASRQQPPNSGLSEFLTPTRLQVSEVTVSDFNAAEQTWTK